jgi:RNA polymerase sigma factor (sigma-70 family)
MVDQQPGDPDTRVAAVYELHARRLAGLARTLTGSVESGDDLVQDVFVRILRAVEADPGYLREPVWPLLRVTLVRLVLQRRRGLARELRRRARVYQRPDPRIWEEDVDVVAALLRLPPRMRACIVLHHVEDLPLDQVAAILGSKTNTVASQLQTARRRLRDSLVESESNGMQPTMSRSDGDG